MSKCLQDVASASPTCNMSLCLCHTLFVSRRTLISGGCCGFGKTVMDDIQIRRQESMFGVWWGERKEHNRRRMIAQIIARIRPFISLCAFHAPTPRHNRNTQNFANRVAHRSSFSPPLSIIFHLSSIMPNFDSPFLNCRWIMWTFQKCYLHFFEISKFSLTRRAFNVQLCHFHWQRQAFVHCTVAGTLPISLKHNWMMLGGKKFSDLVLDNFKAKMRGIR